MDALEAAGVPVDEVTSQSFDVEDDGQWYRVAIVPDPEMRTLRSRPRAPLHDHGVPVSIGAGVCECGEPI